jgi:hypothetical protein
LIVADNHTTPVAKKCDMKQELCCDPYSFADAYFACLEENCRAIQEPPKTCDDFGMCTNSCSLNCCCFFRRTYDGILAWTKGLRDAIVSTVIMMMTLQQGFADKVEELPEAESVDVPESEAIDVAKYFLDVMLDILKIVIGTPVVFFALVTLHSCFKAVFMRFWKTKVRKEEKVRSDHLTKEERERMNKDPEALEKADLETYMSLAEQDRLGGVEQYAITKVSGISSFWVFLTNSFGLGFFYCLMENPVRISVCVLGKSGRMMVLDRKPLMSATTATKMFIGLGMSVIGFALVFHVFLRNAERSVLQARKHEDPAVRNAINADPVSNFLVGKAHFVTIAFIAAEWLFWLPIMKARIRPWAYDDERNYYESKEASVAQYFRTGVRGAIPCLSKRRRKGGMRLFFGPYPTSDLFGHLGSRYEVLQNLSPMLVLPSETSNAYPAPGTGEPLSPEDRAGVAQMILGLLNLVLGILGIIMFAIHMYNLLTNVQNCPIGSAVRPCVAGVDCTYVARAPWFHHYLVMENLRSPDQVARDQLQAKVSINTIGLWLGTDTVEATTALVLNVSETACYQRVEELVSGPNSTMHSPAADTEGKFDAGNYLHSYHKYGWNVRWDPEAQSCRECPSAIALKYMTSVSNVVEIMEILMLMATIYAGYIVYSLLNQKLQNCPMIDIPFESDPGSIHDIDVDRIEKACLQMIGYTFAHRYKYSGVPEHIGKLEAEINLSERKEEETGRLEDPWKYDERATKWEEYDLHPRTNARMMYVSKALLGILQGEEVVAAWSEAPRLTFRQKFIVFGGMFFFMVFPAISAIYNKKVQCFAEAIVTSVIHYALCDYFILRRRPQAGFILTSRRIFQVTKRPAYYDVFGRVEPLIKMDVLIHDCGITYSSLTMEAYVPLWRRVLGYITNKQFFRRGQVVVQGSRGIFKFWRNLGDTRQAFEHMSRICFMQKKATLHPHEGEVCMRKEKESGKEEDLPDPWCSCCCCPYTPPPVAMKGTTLLDRYAKRVKGEKDVYSRKLAIRPSTCGELCCGRGCNIECSCCCCCQMDELLTDMTISTHRILVEQRTVQRYCRFFACCRETPNIRVTMLAHIKASAYLREAPAQPWGLSRVRTDLTVKLLHAGGREYASGLMLHQKPYLIVNKKDLPMNDKLWVEHICKFYDIIATKEQYADEDSASEEEDDDANAVEDDDEEFGPTMDQASDIDTPPGSEKGEKGKGKKGKGKKGKCKSMKPKDGDSGPATSDADGESRGKGKSKGKGKKGMKGKKGKDKMPLLGPDAENDEEDVAQEPQQDGEAAPDGAVDREEPPQQETFGWGVFG